MSKKIKILIALCIVLAISITIIVSTISKNKDEEDLITYQNITFEYTEEDKNEEWADEDTIYITLDDSNTNISNNGASFSDGNVKITKKGTYHVTGTLSKGSIIIDANQEDIIHLILDNVNLTYEESSPIYVKQAAKVIITLAQNSTNTLTDGNNYNYDDVTNEEPNATIFSKDDLTINGSGTLNVNANFKDGIASKDGLTIINSNINVTAVDDGIRGKDYVVMNNANINITSEADGIKSTEDADTSKGYVLIEGGLINITTTQEQTELTSSKGIKAITNIQIEDGNITINSTDDGIHSNGNININGGTFNIKTGDDGIHADTSLYINNGYINIVESYEGIESTLIEINGGKINITSSDDGINVAGGNDNSFMGGRGGKDIFNTSSDSNQKLTINAGEIYVNSSGDGIDINGSAYMNGGILTVDGPTDSANGALDYDREFVINNGTLIVCGSIGMTQTTSENSAINCLNIAFSQTQNMGSKIRILDKNGNEILSYIPSKQYQSAIIASPLLNKGEEYTIYTDETQLETVKIENVLTNVGNMGMNNMIMPNGGQMPNDMQIPEGEIPDENMQRPEGKKERPNRGGMQL